MQFDKSRSNYFVDSIERSIVMDTSIGTMSQESKDNLFKDAMAKFDKFPELKKILNVRHLHAYNLEGVNNFARMSVIPSKIVISDERIKDMCRTPFWNNYGHGEFGGAWKFSRCPNLEIHSSCPYYSPSADEVRIKLDESDIFVAIQTKLLHLFDASFQFPILHRFIKDIRSLLGEQAVIHKFGNGPCGACMQECLGMGKCRNPKLQTPALESQGVPVGQLCRDIAYFSGDKAWEIKFLRHFGLPNMTPKKWKFTVGLAIKLPSNDMN